MVSLQRELDDSDSNKDMKDKTNEFIEHGLSTSEAEERVEQFGLNTIQEKREIGVLVILLSQFRSPLIYILVIAALVTLILRDYVDTAVIGLAVVMNTILGFYQEYKAQKALVSLRSLLSPKAAVIRDGKRETIDASEVVPGDICLVGLGERIPADGLVVEATDFSITEAILTGESMPVHKKIYKQAAKYKSAENNIENFWKGADADYKVFSGTIVASGTAKMLVVVTGMETEVGKIAKSLRETREEPTPLQKRIQVLSNQLAVFVAVIAFVIFFTGILVNGEKVPLIERFEVMFTTSVAVAVAAIPEGLAVSLTVILAIGMQRILRRKALVRKLVAAETLGSVSVICADKTGTLTEGVMKVTKTEFTDEDLGVRATVLSNDQRDPLEIAMWNWVQEEKRVDPQHWTQIYERIDSLPFSSEEKFTAKLSAEWVYIMGAPEVVLGFCKMENSERDSWFKKFDEYGMMGLRMVGFAARKTKEGEKKLTRKSVKSGLTWLGIVGLEDPVRSGVSEALAEAKAAGIKIKVITGDYRATAEAVMERMGLFDKSITPSQRQEMVLEGVDLERFSDDELRGRVAQSALFTRIDPIQKLRIVDALQANGEVVAMTGDGVNDAPALKKSDIGVVVSGATDVAKETADMVLLEDNFATIVAAVEEGRGIFENLRKVLLYLLSDSFSEMVLVMGSLVAGIPLPLTAAQILWINLITDGFPQLALTVEPKDRELMKQPPRNIHEPLVDLEIKLLIFLISLVTGMFTLVAFFWFWNFYDKAEMARSVAFAMLGVDSLIYVFSARSLSRPIWQTSILGNPWLILAVFGGFLFQLAALYSPFLQRFLETRPLFGFEWLVVFIQALLVIGIIEAVKWWFLKKRKQRRRWTKVIAGNA